MDKENCEEYRIELQMPVCQVNGYCPYQRKVPFSFEGETFYTCGKVETVTSKLPIIIAVAPKVSKELEEIVLEELH